MQYSAFSTSDEAVIPVHPIPPVASVAPVPSVPLVAPVAPVPLVAAVPPGPLDHLIAPTSLPAQRRNIFNITLYLKTQNSNLVRTIHLVFLSFSCNHGLLV